MLKVIEGKLKKIMENTVLRFPASVVCTMVLVCLAIMEVHDLIELSNDFIVTFFVYGGVVSFIIDMVLENLDKKKWELRLMCYGAASMILVAMHFFGVFDSRYSVCIFFALISLAVLTLKRKGAEDFEQRLASVMDGSFWSFLFSSALFVGVLVILGSLNLLFGAHIYRACADNAILIFGFVLPILFLSSIPKDYDNLENHKNLYVWMKFLTIPFSLIGLVILDVYAFGSYLGLFSEVKYYIFLGFAEFFLPIYVFTLILLKPLKGEFYKSLRQFGALLVMPIVIAMFVFVKQLGIGILEYFALVTAFMSIISVGLISLKKSKYQHLIFLVLAIVILLIGFGPLSIENVVRSCLGN